MIKRVKHYIAKDKIMQTRIGWKLLQDKRIKLSKKEMQLIYKMAEKKCICWQYK